MKLSDVLANTSFDENAVATHNVTRDVDLNDLKKVSDAELVQEINARSWFSQSDMFNIEFENRLVKHGTPRANVAAAQIDYILPGETLQSGEE